MSEGRVERVHERMSRAGQALHDAHLLLDAGSLAAAVNRAYYAAFYAACALLESRDLASRKHRGVLSLFGREFIVSGLMAREHGSALHDLFRQRNRADYGAFVEFDRETTAELVEAAEAFIADAGKLVDRLLAEAS